jgi:hypothetical protein
MNLAELREKQRLKLLEERIAGCCEERDKLSVALSGNSKNKYRGHHELRMYELCMEIVLLWRDHTRLVGSRQTDLDGYLM